MLQRGYEDFGSISNENVIARRRSVRLRVVQALQVRCDAVV